MDRVNCSKLALILYINVVMKKAESPLDLTFSLEKLKMVYEKELEKGPIFRKERAKTVLNALSQNPELVDGIRDFTRITDYNDEIDIIFEDMFSTIMQDNEIKVATMPFDENVVKATRRYNEIISSAGLDFELEIRNFNEDHFYIMACSIILKTYYNYNIDFRRPFFYDIPDAEGIMRHYRILYNGDYISIEKKKNTPEIFQEDVDILLDNFDNIDMWKEKFPPNSWLFKGFVIASMYDATADVSLSNFKSSLLKFEQEELEFTENLNTIFKSIFNLKEVHVGFVNYNNNGKTFEAVAYKDVKSFLLYDNDIKSCKTTLCKGSYSAIFNKGAYFAVSDVEKFHKMDTSIEMYSNLIDQDILSIIIAPIRYRGELLGLLEIASPVKGALNSINANKLLDVMPYLVDAVLRSKQQSENEIELLIQEECTSIHNSVYWKFEKEARRFLKLQANNDLNVQFRDVVFRDVYPLYGQIDIKGSSEARNTAAQKDLILQLKSVIEILEAGYKEQKLPIYHQYTHALHQFLADIQDHLEVDSERKILNYINQEVKPLFNHLNSTSPHLKTIITEYKQQVEDNLGLVYKHRKVYDDTVMLINKRMATILDKEQKKAQKMYPHFFERFKTDGVEHNIYIGESITETNSFHKVYLYNLRLWQMQVMCEMENAHFNIAKKLEQPLEVASMILVFNTSLSVRYRMDEKRFDVDGTYNARYEVVKKRVDKAHIKGTKERITQAGKLVIIYSQKSDELEYLKYIAFLQTKKYLGPEVEIVELEELQAVSGLKAIRVNILYSSNTKKAKNVKKEYYTYEDLLEEVKS